MFKHIHVPNVSSLNWRDVFLAYFKPYFFLQLVTNVSLHHFFVLNRVLDQFNSSSSLKRALCINNVCVDRSVASSTKAFIGDCTWVISFECFSALTIISITRIKHVTDIVHPAANLNFQSVSIRCEIPGRNSQWRNRAAVILSVSSYMSNVSVYRSSV